MNSTNHTLLSSTSRPPEGVRPRRNSAPPACACPVVHSLTLPPPTSNSINSCCNQPSSTRLPLNVIEPSPILNDGVHTPWNSNSTSPHIDPVPHVDTLFNASEPMNPSHGALRGETSGQTPRFAPYPNHSRSQSLYSNILLPRQQLFLQPPMISTFHAQTNPSGIAAPRNVDLVTLLAENTTPTTLEEFLAPIPTRSNPAASRGNMHHAATSPGTVFAAPIEPVVSNCSCSSSCSCVLCSGSNFEKVVMSVSLGTESDNCQSCNDCFDCKSLLNELPQLAPLRDASIAAASALPASQLGLPLQTDQLDPRHPFITDPDSHKEVSPGWPASAPGTLSLPLNSRPTVSPEADLANRAWYDYFLSAPLDNVWPIGGNTVQPAPTRTQSSEAPSSEAPVAQGPSFNGPFDDAYHYAS